MFAVKKTIPKLVAGMLALTGCAVVNETDPGVGGSGGTGGTGGGGMAGAGGTGGMGGLGGSAGNALDDAIAAFCMKSIDCGFVTYTVPECVDYYSDFIVPGDPTCYAVGLSYFDCLLGVPGCDDLSDCYDAGDAFIEACS